MTRNDVTKELLRDLYSPKEIRTTDGMKFVVKNVEHWALNGDQLLIVPGGPRAWNFLSIRNIASIGPVTRSKRA